MRNLLTSVVAMLAVFTFALEDVVAPATAHLRRHWKRAVASFYGYGYGARGACGELYSNGVANKTMPCGTRLVMCARRCSVAVVDDRGPYVAGRTFDLSMSLAWRLGFDMGAGVASVRWDYR